MKPKVLYVIDNLEFGGGERGFAQLAGALKGRYEILFACHPGGLLGERLRAAGVAIRPLDFRGRVSLSRILRLSSIIRAEGVHLVHSMGARADFSAGIAAKLAGAPVVLSTVAMFVEGYDAPPSARALYRAGIRLSERLSDAFIAVSDAVREVLVEEHGIPAEKVVRIYNGVELDAFRPGPRNGFLLKRELGLNPDAPLVGTIGRLVYQKAHDVFLEAAALAAWAVPDAQFLIVGEGPLRPRLERMTRALDLRNCRFVGFRSDIPEILSLMDVFALPSILEGLPRALLEAMALAKPVIATRIDGVREVVEHGATGLLIPPGEPAALADAIVRLVRDGNLAARLGAAARRCVVTRFTVDRMVAEVDRLYATALRKKGIGA